jgi:putative phosphoribosyl transferase
MSTPVTVQAGPSSAGIQLPGDLVVPRPAYGCVLFAHGSGSSRHSPRNRAVAQVLQERGFATVLLDLLTHDEELVDQHTAELRFDIGLLGERLVAAIDQVRLWELTADLPLGVFGASTGAAGALVAAAARPSSVRAVVSRGGRPDLAGPEVLRNVRAPTLLIVGGADQQVLALNEQAATLLTTTYEIQVVPGASHLFEEPGTLEAVSELAAGWFERHLGAAPKGS